MNFRVYTFTHLCFKFTQKLQHIDKQEFRLGIGHFTAIVLLRTCLA